MRYKLEVCAYTVQSALAAEKAGAHRVELCSDDNRGGTTPSYGALKYAREKLSIDLYPIIRPRAGHFLYDDEEFEVIVRDILFCREIGCAGISTGVQLKSGAIDSERMKRIAELAYPMGVTCHRVFDVTPDPFEALETLIGCGCERILTSGQQATAHEGVALLAQLVQRAGQRIIIMPGAGVRAVNIKEIAERTRAVELHTSARSVRTDDVVSARSSVADFGTITAVDEQELEHILAILNDLQT